jgi:hydroxymethylglutaryl-CoA synthase
MNDAGVLAGGVYIPRFGVAGRRGRRFQCGSDEDAVTLAVEAGERALARWPGGVASVGGLFVALSHGPEVRGPQSQIVREALDLPAAARVATVEADGLGGMAALQAALDAVHHGTIATAMVVAAEAAHGPDHRRSAGAAAVIVSAAASNPAVEIEEVARRSGLTHAGGDTRFLQHRYQALVQEAIKGLEDNGFDDVVFSGGFPAGGPAGLDGADFGAAGSLVALVHAMRALPSRTVGLVAYGAGQVGVFRLRIPGGVDCGWDVPDGTLEPPVPSGEAGPALSLPAESPYFARTWGESLRLDAARCERCDRIAFPPSQRRICAGCHGQRWRPYRLARTGVVASHIDNHFLPSGFPPRLVFALGELDDGQRYWAPMPAEVPGDAVAIGDRVALHLRRFTVRDGLPVYGMKFVPA